MLRIQLFGHLELTWQDQPLAMLGKTSPLLTYLLLNRHAPVQRDTIAFSLWPDSPETLARLNLRRTLHQLRRSLPPAEDWLTSTADTVQWNPNSDYWLDVADFERLADFPEHLAEAVALYQGDLLPDIDAEWLLYAREWLRYRYQACLERLVVEQHRLRNYPVASHYAAQLLARDPLHEQATRQLMTIRYEMGDRAAALAAYSQFANRLAAELATVPMVATTALYEAIRTDQPLPSFAATVQPPTEGPLPAGLPFVGRQPELDLLTQAWQWAAGGQGALYFLTGEAGVGKSRLCAELAAVVVGQGGWVLRGGTAKGESRPYQAVAAILREAVPLLKAGKIAVPTLRAILPLLPELVSQQTMPLPPLEPERERDRLYQAVAECLTTLAASRPLLLILEDMHWAGQACISLLQSLVGRIGGSAILIVATHREEETGRDHPLREFRRQVTTISRQLALERLSGEAVDELVAQLPGRAPDEEVAAAWYRMSEGNPFFLGELIYGWLGDEQGMNMIEAGPLPLKVQQLLAHRIASLSTNTQLVAEVASVVGASFSLELVGEAAGLSEGQVLSALDQLLDQRLVREGAGGEYGFNHHLIREAFYQRVEAGSRQRRHRRIGLLLEEAAQQQAAEIAAHFAAGGEGEQAQAWYLKAAEQAVSLYADNEALVAADRALLLGNDPYRCFAALALQEGVYHRLGQREQQELVLARLTAIAEELGEADLQAEVLHRRLKRAAVMDRRDERDSLIAALFSLATTSGNQHWQAVALLQQGSSEVVRGDIAGNQHLEAALALFSTLGETDNQVMCYCWLSQAASGALQYERASALLVAARACITPDNWPALRRIVQASIVAAHAQADYAAVHTFASEMLSLCQTIHDVNGEADAYAMLATATYDQQQVQAALDHCEQARRIYVAIGKRMGEAAVLARFGIVYCIVGQNERGLTLLQESADLYAACGNQRGQAAALMQLALHGLWAGRFVEAKRAASEGLRLAQAIGSSWYQEFLHSTLGALETMLGELTLARTNLQASLRLKLAGSKSELEETSSYLLLIALQLGDLRTARVIAARCRREQLWTEQGSNSYPQRLCWLLACYQRAAGERQLAQHYLAEAHRYFSAALTESETKLAEYADAQWRDYYLNIHFHRELLAAYERDEWPAYANPGYQRPSPTPACTHCQSTNTVKAGLNPSGSQRYQCQSCDRYFTPDRKPMGHQPDLHAEAGRLRREGQSLSAIARSLGVNRQSVANWLHEQEAKLAFYLYPFSTPSYASGR